jgi:hypothetical protein
MSVQEYSTISYFKFNRFILSEAAILLRFSAKRSKAAQMQASTRGMHPM